jgi:serine protease Do
VTRGSVGVVFNAQPNPAIQRVYGVDSGVTIASVSPNGPAETAGLKTGDTIIAIDGKKIASGDDLVGDIASRKPGSKASVTYVRDGKEQKTSVTIADRSKLFPNEEDAEDIARGETPEQSRLGLAVRSLTPEMAEKLNLPNNRGVVVQDVKPGSFAEDAGLSRGLVIVEINKQPVNNEEDFRRIQGSLKSGQDVVFLVRDGRGGRNGGTIFLGGTLP